MNGSIIDKKGQSARLLVRNKLWQGIVFPMIEEPIGKKFPSHRNISLPPLIIKKKK
jgi:hypothetical protein